MKALSLHQPWAHLVAYGHKSVETRSWSTCHRGPLLILAAKKWNVALASVCREPFYRDVFSEQIGDGHGGWSTRLRDELVFGAIVAIADLVDVREVGSPMWSTFSDKELAFGDYTPGRFAWQMKNVHRLLVPVPWIGRQQLFNIPDAVMAGQALWDVGA